MTTLGKYELHEQLGKGGFGTVYRATDNIGRTVAIKVLKPGFADDPEVLDRFKREALAAGSLFHSHIATILDFDEADGRVFIVMRYIEGQPLDKLLKERGKLPWEEAVQIIEQVAEALQFAHDKGFIHRDIKPGNIIISPTEGAVLTDFGLVKAVTASGLSTTGVMLGTPAYIAPEIWSGKPASPATDVYSLACVLYEMITGNVLFEGESTPEIMTKHVLGEPHYSENLPEPIKGVIAKALAKDPQDRLPNMEKFIAALNQVVGNLKLTNNTSLEATHEEGQKSPQGASSMKGLTDHTQDNRQENTWEMDSNTTNYSLTLSDKGKNNVNFINRNLWVCLGIIIIGWSFPFLVNQFIDLKIITLWPWPVIESLFTACFFGLGLRKYFNLQWTKTIWLIISLLFLFYLSDFTAKTTGQNKSELNTEQIVKSLI